MTLIPILHYFGLAFLIFHLIKLFPLNLARAPKILQLVILLGLHASVLFFLPPVGLFTASLLLFFTLLFTVIADNLKLQFYKNFFTVLMKGESLPEILLLLNWDFHALALVKLKRLYPALEAQTPGVILPTGYPGLDRDRLWHQDLLQVLHVTDRLDLAKPYLQNLHIDFSKAGLPYGLVTTLAKLYLRLEQPESARQCIAYQEEYFHDSQHHLLNLTNYMSFYAFSGDEENLARLLAVYPQLHKTLTVPYWQAICCLRQGQEEGALRLLDHFEEKLPDGFAYFRRYIQRIRQNPALYPPLVGQHGPVTRDLFPRPLLQQETLPMAARHKPLIVYILCGLIALTTVIQFWLTGPSSLTDFFQLTRMTGMDLLRAGAFSADYIHQGQWIRLITACFLHGSWLHLLLNLFGLFQIGSVIERFYNGVRLLLIFLVAGLCGNLLTMVSGTNNLSIGASGGVFGILAALVVYFLWYRKVINKSILRNFLINFAVIIGINVMLGIRNPQINNLAHLGGFLGGGALAALILLLETGNSPLKPAWNSFVKIAGVLVLVVTFGLWPGLLKYDYWGKMPLTQQAQVNGYTLSLPANWITGEDQAIIDQLGEIQTNIYGDDLSSLPHAEYPEGGLLIYLENFESHLLDNTQPDLHFISTGKPANLGNGWFSFSVRQPELNPRYVASLHVYAKIFSQSLCLIQQGRYKEYKGYERLLKRILDSIREQ